MNRNHDSHCKPREEGGHAPWEGGKVAAMWPGERRKLNGGLEFGLACLGLPINRVTLTNVHEKVL
jgi:hypothetical protein